MRLLVHEPMKTASTATSFSGVPACRSMYSSARSAAARSLGSAKSVGRGHDVRERHALTGVGAPGDERLELVRVEEHLGVVDRALVAGEGPPVGDGILPVLALRRVRAALEVREGRLVRRDHAGAGAGLDRHVADRHPPLHRERADRAAAELEHVALPAVGADLRDDREDDVLRGDAGLELALDGDRHRLEGLERQRLGRQDVLDLARADAERHRAERAVGARCGCRRTRR